MTIDNLKNHDDLKIVPMVGYHIVMSYCCYDYYIIQVLP